MDTAKPLPRTDPTGTRRAAYLKLVRDEDIMRSLDRIDDDTLVTIGTGLAVEAFEGRWIGTRDIAVARFSIPADLIELLAAAALTALTPTMGALVLARPNEASLAEVRAWLASHGFKAGPAHRKAKGLGRRA